VTASEVEGGGALDWRAIRALAFDLDGTLLDTLPDIAAASDAMLRDLGRPPAGPQTVRGFIGEGIAMLVKRLLTGRLDGEPDPTLFGEGHRRFMDHYARHLNVYTRPFAGVIETVAVLRAAGWPMACVTNKAEAFTRPLLEQHGLMSAMRVVVGGDTLPERKPHPLPLRHVAAALGVAPAELLMVGDSVTDVRAARNAGCPVVVLPWGYSGGAAPGSLGADAVLASTEELTEQLRDARPAPTPSQSAISA
jgi:phosphoglycolate phosphatase